MEIKSYNKIFRFDARLPLSLPAEKGRRKDLPGKVNLLTAACHEKEKEVKKGKDLSAQKTRKAKRGRIARGGERREGVWMPFLASPASFSPPFLIFAF